MSRARSAPWTRGSARWVSWRSPFLPPALGLGNSRPGSAPPPARSPDSSGPARSTERSYACLARWLVLLRLTPWVWSCRSPDRGSGPACLAHGIPLILANRCQDPAHKELDVTDTATPAASYLTQEAYDRLKKELTKLTGEDRAEISKKIEAARDEGDLKENGGYHAAKEEQGKMEARIRQLTQLLENAIVGHAPPDDGIVEPGMVVTVEVFGETLTFLLGSREIADGSGLDVYSEKSPMGKAILDKKAGDVTSYLPPKGNESVQVKVLSAKPYVG